MKTLDEVIDYCEGKQTCGEWVGIADALHYLKEYRKKQNILKGKWQVTSIKDETWGICSNCGFKQKAGELNFCPNCGADMREDIPIEYFENGGI